MPFMGNQLQDLYLEFLEMKSANMPSLDKLEISFHYYNEFYLHQKNPMNSIKFIVIVGNSDMKNQEFVRNLLGF